MMRRTRNIARDLAGLALAVLGALALLALATLLASRHEWLAVGLLAVGVVLVSAGVGLGRYDLDETAPRRRREARGRGRELGDDAIEMVPRVRSEGDPTP